MFSSRDIFFSHISFHVFEIQYGVIPWNRAGKLFVNRGPAHPISRLWDSMVSLIW